MSFVFLSALVALYFLPALIGFGRAHRQAVPILLLNVFLGWTCVGWVIALCWSATAQERRA